MNKDKILTCLAKIIEKDITEVASLSENTPLITIGFESIKFIQLIVLIEEEFNIEVNDSDLIIENFYTLRKLYQTLEKYIYEDTTMKKCLILDCDDVLWKGIAGEEKVIIDTDVIKFHNMIIELYHKGILLCLCSKNQQRNIDEIFENYETPLKKKYILIEKTNGSSKSTDIEEIASELNLSLDSFVFVDNSDYEIGLIDAILPEVFTLKVDYSNLDFIDYIYSSFNMSTNESSSNNRTQLYREQKEREKLKLRYDTVEEYNLSLNMLVALDIDNIDNIARIAELSQRTNQFNLSSTRYSESDLTYMMNNLVYNVFSISVSDIYGDMGIVGAAIVRKDSTYAVIENFIISCRAFGRNIETNLMDKIKDHIQCKKLFGIYTQTLKNERYRFFYDANGVDLYEV